MHFKHLLIPFERLLYVAIAQHFILILKLYFNYVKMDMDFLILLQSTISGLGKSESNVITFTDDEFEIHLLMLDLPCNECLIFPISVH